MKQRVQYWGPPALERSKLLEGGTQMWGCPMHPRDWKIIAAAVWEIPAARRLRWSSSPGGFPTLLGWEGHPCSDLLVLVVSPYSKALRTMVAVIPQGPGVLYIPRPRDHGYCNPQDPGVSHTWALGIVVVETPMGWGCGKPPDPGDCSWYNP